MVRKGGPGRMEGKMRKEELVAGKQAEAGAVGPAVLLSLVGLMAHNALEFGGRGLLALETGTVPVVLVQGAVYVGWWRLPNLRAWLFGLLGALALLHLVGGALISVLPLPIMPFEPEQSLSHYLSHLIYGVTQLPLLWLVAKALWPSSGADRGPRDEAH